MSDQQGRQLWEEPMNAMPSTSNVQPQPFTQGPQDYSRQTFQHQGYPNQQFFPQQMYPTQGYQQQQQQPGHMPHGYNHPAGYNPYMGPVQQPVFVQPNPYGGYRQQPQPRLNYPTGAPPAVSNQYYEEPRPGPSSVSQRPSGSTVYNGQSGFGNQVRYPQPNPPVLESSFDFNPTVSQEFKSGTNFSMQTNPQIMPQVRFNFCALLSIPLFLESIKCVDRKARKPTYCG